MTKKSVQGRTQILRLEISSVAFFDQNIRYFEKKINKERVNLATALTTAATTATPTIIIKPE